MFVKAFIQAEGGSLCWQMQLHQVKIYFQKNSMGEMFQKQHELDVFKADE